MANVKSILRLHALGWSQRRIAEELGVHRETVARYVSQAKSAASEAPPGPEESPDGSKPATSAPRVEGSKPATAPPGSGGARSECEPYRDRILELLELGLSAQRIFQDLGEEGFEGSYYSVRRFVRRLGARQELPFRRIEKAPGEEAQVDFGTGAWVRQASGKKRRPYVFRIVLSHSRKAYSEVVYRQTTENFLRCIENAFWSFGGCPQSLVIDNLRAAVKKVDWFEPELNPKVEEFCRHYGVSILPTRPFTPRHKGKVEKGIDYVQDNALKGRMFECLEEQNDHLQHWERTVADTRIHGTTRQQVARAFAAEKPSLQALPTERFPFFHEGQRSVNRDGHAEVDKSFYSVPPEYVGRRVWARWDSRLVRILNQKLEVITTHAKLGPGKVSTHPEHLHSSKISAVERGGQWLLRKASEIGPYAEEWAVALFKYRGIQAIRTLQGLLSLTETHESQSIDAACQIAHSYGSYRLASIRRLMKTQSSLQHEFEFTNEHPIIRDITVYGELVRDSIKSQAKRLEHSPLRSPRKDYHE